MVSGIGSSNLTQAYMPFSSKYQSLQKTNDLGMTVEVLDQETAGSLEQIKSLDRDKDGIISLDELKKADNKNGLIQHIINSFEEYNAQNGTDCEVSLTDLYLTKLVREYQNADNQPRQKSSVSTTV